MAAHAFPPLSPILECVELLWSDDTALTVAPPLAASPCLVEKQCTRIKKTLRPSSAPFSLPTLTSALPSLPTPASAPDPLLAPAYL
jgi:hypothetical protein